MTSPDSIPAGMDPAEALYELGFSRKDAKAFTDWHARELARKQREFAEGMIDWELLTEPAQFMSIINATVSVLTDLIDPDKEVPYG